MDIIKKKICKLYNENQMLLIILLFIISIAVYYFYKHLKSKSNNNNIIGGGDILILKLFYVDWCGHCKAFKPTWNKLKNKKISHVKFKDINCETNKEIASKEGIEGFPTIRLYNSNDELVQELEGERNIDNIMNLIENNRN